MLGLILESFDRDGDLTCGNRMVFCGVSSLHRHSGDLGVFKISTRLEKMKAPIHCTVTLCAGMTIL
jgi:hypothetical protein